MTAKKPHTTEAPKRDRIVIDDVEIKLATPIGKPKHRSAAAIRAAVRAHVAKKK